MWWHVSAILTCRRLSQDVSKFTPSLGTQLDPQKLGKKRLKKRRKRRKRRNENERRRKRKRNRRKSRKKDEDTIILQGTMRRHPSANQEAPH